MSHYDLEAALEREEFPVAWALMDRANDEIDKARIAILGAAGVDLPFEGFPNLEFQMRDYEAAYALFCLDAGINATPAAIRTEAIDSMPRAVFEDTAANEAATILPAANAEIIREVVRSQPLEILEGAGFTGFLGIHDSLQSTHLSVGRAAQKTGLQPCEILLEDDLFEAMVRANTTPNAVVARALQASRSITPQALLDESLEAGLQRKIASDTITRPEDLAAEVQRYEMARQNPIYLESCIPVSSALRHGVAVTVLDQVGTIWSPKALRGVNPKLREQLDYALRKLAPITDESGHQPTKQQLNQIANLEPSDFI